MLSLEGARGCSRTSVSLTDPRQPFFRAALGGATVSEKKFLAVEDGQPIKFSELAHLIAAAMHPDDTERLEYGAARINLDDELAKAAQDHKLVVRNPAGMGQLTLLAGSALQRAVVLPHDIQPWLVDRGIELRTIPQGNGPTFWTLDNAALALAEQEGWHDGARGSLLDRMVEAAKDGTLVVRDPHTDLPYRPAIVRTFYELVMPSDVNAWLEQQDVSYRWEVALPDVVLGSDRTYTSLVNAAELLVGRTWPAQNGRYALRAVQEKGWRFFSSQIEATETLCGEMELPLPKAGLLDSRLSEQLRKVVYGEADALSIMRSLDLPKRQKQIDALLSLGRLPLYEWPSRIRTNEPNDAWVNEAELVGLLIKGEHLDAALDSQHTAGQLPVQPMQREAAHDANVLTALRELGFDPRRLPRAPAGKASPAKSAAKAALPQMSPEVFKKAWQRLRKAGDIGEG